VAKRRRPRWRGGVKKKKNRGPGGNHNHGENKHGGNQGTRGFPGVIRGASASLCWICCRAPTTELDVSNNVWALAYMGAENLGTELTASIVEAVWRVLPSVNELEAVFRGVCTADVFGLRALVSGRVHRVRLLSRIGMPP